jgi:hypothetical protein
MRWFRNTIRQGTWLALIALAINLGLSFGHFHAIDGKVSGRGIAAAVSVASPDDGQRQGIPDDHADYLCPICMAATAMANALASTPPALPLEFAAVSLDRTIEPVLLLVELPRAAFQPRGPPIS